MDSKCASDAWAAGLFEGEGSILYYNDLISLRLGMTDRDVVIRFQSVMGCGTVRETKKAKAHHLQCYEWTLHRKAEVGPAMERLLPYLGERRTARWNEALAKRAVAFAPRVCPQCEEEFVPVRKAQVCCGHDCSWRYSKRVGRYTNRGQQKRTLENGYARTWTEQRAAGTLRAQRKARGEL